MLIGQCCLCRNITGGLQIFGASLGQGHAHFSYGCDFMMSLGKLHLHAKFEVASCNRCRNIKGEPQIFGNCPSPGPRPLFLLRVILWWALANASCLPSLNSLALSVAEILTGNPKFCGPLLQGQAHFSSGSDFTMGLGKLQLRAKFELCSFSRCRNAEG